MNRGKIAKYSVVAIVAASVGVGLDGCARSPSRTDPTCRSASPLVAENLTGQSLPARTLVLTFDDGPGPRTAELSAYLASQGIAATFFINGRNADPKSNSLSQIVGDGHIIANHTQNHISLTGKSTGTLALDQSRIISEITETDAIIGPLVTGAFFFRAPYGDFDQNAADAIIQSPMNKYIGPIYWDIGERMGDERAADWDCWRRGSDNTVKTPSECANLYIQEIESVDHGIVLMHDPYFIDDDPQKGGTVDMVKLMIPVLKAKGYSFVQLDKVPAFAPFLPPPETPAPTDSGIVPPGDPAAQPTDAGLSSNIKNIDASVDATTTPARVNEPTPPVARQGVTTKTKQQPDPCASQ